MTSINFQNSLNTYVGRVFTAGHYSTYPKDWIYLRAASRSYSKDQPRLMVKENAVHSINPANAGC
jgi:hypothetical protein